MTEYRIQGRDWIRVQRWEGPLYKDTAVTPEEATPHEVVQFLSIALEMVAKHPRKFERHAKNAVEFARKWWQANPMRPEEKPSWRER